MFGVLVLVVSPPSGGPVLKSKSLQNDIKWKELLILMRLLRIKSHKHTSTKRLMADTEMFHDMNVFPSTHSSCSYSGFFFSSLRHRFQLLYMRAALYGLNNSQDSFLSTHITHTVCRVCESAHEHSFNKRSFIHPPKKLYTYFRKPMHCTNISPNLNRLIEVQTVCLWCICGCVYETGVNVI